MPDARSIGSSDFQHNIGACLSEVCKGTPLIVTSHGRPEVAVIAADEYERLMNAARHLAVLREHGAQPGGVAVAMRKFDHDAAIRMYQDGATLREVGVHFGVTTERVRQVIVRRGLTTRGCSAPRKMKTRPLPEAEIAAAYRAGATLETLIRDYRTHFARIKGVLARAGVPLRPLGAHARGPKVDLPDAEIAARYRAGEDTRHLAVRYEVSRRTIGRRLHAMGVQMRPKGCAGRRLAEAAQAAHRAVTRGNE